MFDRIIQSQSFQSHLFQFRRKLILENIDDIDLTKEIFKNKNSFF